MFRYILKIEGVRGDNIPGHPNSIEVISWYWPNDEMNGMGRRPPE